LEFDLPELLLDLFFDPAEFYPAKEELSKIFLSKNLWAKHERSRRRTHKSKTLQDAVSQPGAGQSRGQNVEKFYQKIRILLPIPFNLTCIRQEFHGGKARHLSLEEKAKKSHGDGLGGRPGEAATCLQKISLRSTPTGFGLQTW
jgi:hypothetical protein